MATSTTANGATVREERNKVVVDGMYGWGGSHPPTVQCCNNVIGFVTAYSVFAILLGMHSNGFVSLNVSSLERRFGFDSSISGLIVAGYDIGFCVATSLVTYYGASRHRPRIIAVGSAMYGLGCLIYIIPHFATPLYVTDENFTDTCSTDANVTTCSMGGDNLNGYLYVLLLSTLLNGAAGAPLLTLGLAYIEDSLPKHASPLYLGLCNGAVILGPAIGFIVGGVTLREFYVDFDKVDTSSIALLETDPAWVGAWWLGPIIAMALCWVNVMPLAGFPKHLPGTAKSRADRNADLPQNASADIAEREGFGRSIRDFPKAFLCLLKNSTLVITTLASCLDAFVINGFSAFMAKFIENEFHQTSGNAALWAGVILVPGGMVGHIVGGWIIGKLKLTTEQLLRMCAVTSFLTVAFTFSALLYCNNADVAGVTSNYSPNDTIVSIEPNIARSNLTSQCNSACTCQEEFFLPVCGSDNNIYFSACHAGCSSVSSNGSEMYTGCVCVGRSSDAISSMPDQSALPGLCPTSCTSLGAFLALFFFVVAFALMTLTTTLIVTFRVTPHSLKSFALGVQWLFVRVLGSIPGPIVFGAIIDFSCVLWQRKQCGEVGACWIYNSAMMSHYMVALSTAAKFLAGSLYCVALIVYKKQEGGGRDDTDEEREDTDPTTTTATIA